MHYACTTKHILSIRLMPGGFSFSIHNPSEASDFFFAHIKKESKQSMKQCMEEALEQYPDLSFAFDKIFVIVAGERFVQMPKALITDQTTSEAAYRCALSEGEDKEEILTNEWGATQTIFGLESQLYHFLRRTFQGFQFVHHTHILYLYFDHRAKMGNFDKEICLIHEHAIDLLVFKHGKLHLVNHFVSAQANDKAYYILAIWQQTQLQKERDYLQYHSSTEQGAQVIEQVTPYLKQVTPLVIPQDSIAFANQHPDAPFDLIVLPLCV